jgi:hypothetical protein
MEFYDTEVRALDGNFKMNVRMAKVETPELLTINNPNYEKLIRDYNHLGNVVIDDCDTKDRLPSHLVLVAASMHESKPVRSLLSAATTNRWRRKRSWAGSS